MILETERLLMRPWKEEDAEECYRYAKDPAVGPIAGWPPHNDIENSRQIIRDVLSKPETYAVIWKGTGLPVGSIGLKTGSATDLTEKPDECEIGYWLGVPYWDRGIMTEAVREMLRHAFMDRGFRKVWAGYYDGNERSKRVQEKCGFRYQWTTDEVDIPQLHEKRKGHVTCITASEWQIGELLEKPYWIIDILPYQVPSDSLGRYFAIEPYFRDAPEIAGKKLGLILKLNCYRHLRYITDADEEDAPAPEKVGAWIRGQVLNILVDGAMIVSDPEDHYMTVYGPDAELLELLKELARSEGLFVWRPEEE